MGLTVGVAANYSCMLFSPNVRASGLSIINNISFAIFNGAFLALASYGISQGLILAHLYIASSTMIICLIVLLVSPKN